MSNESFDPYFKWLGISPADQPPTHYRLLGLDAFTSDEDVISNAADRQMMMIRTFQTGPYGDLSQPAVVCSIVTPETTTTGSSKLGPERLSVQTSRERHSLPPRLPRRQALLRPTRRQIGWPCR